ncbi:DNA-directed DNA polymerase II small subunit [Candidatus Micrarchaeota archaeon]|nr:DNA-directed DNA polymerase II small subunit [Candidatus Micrarchaeota archaeon]
MASVRQQILEKLQEKEVMIAPPALETLEQQERAMDLVGELLSESSELVISEQAVNDFLDSKTAGKKVVQVDVIQKKNYNPPAKSVEPQLELSVRDSDISSKSRCTGSVDDFVRHFRNRFRKQRDVLRGIRSQASGIYPLKEAKSGVTQREFRVIGMVYEKRVTKNGHLLLEIEDEETSANVLAVKDSPAFEQAQKIMLDEMLAFDVRASKSSLLIIQRIVQPGAMLQERRKKTVEEDISMAFLSDLHVGSRYFLQENFQRMLRFLNGEGDEKEKTIAGRIKYISVAGDLVDGIGVYPRQEQQLVTKNIYTQYEILCEFLKNIPEHIEVIICPGNHDAVRTAEPQPAISEEFRRSLNGYSNLHFVGNPSRHRVHGLEHLMYHGTSVDGLISHSAALKEGYEHPEQVAVAMLERRHLCPVYGEDPVVPEVPDLMLIDETPDVFHFGHVHKLGYLEDYNGTFVINSGTWQDRTDFQVRMGHIPSPALFPVYDMKTGKIKVLNFL